MTMELIILTPAEKFLTAVEFNNEELKKELSLALEKYQGLIYTDANIKDAKSDRATLNKFKDAIETKRKEIKAKCLEPYNSFEAKVKELTALIDAPLSAIDERVKQYEAQLKEDKRKVLEDYWAGCEADLSSLLPFGQIFNPKWLNASVPAATACAEMADIVHKVKDDLKAIADLHSEFEVALKDEYLKTLNLSRALALKSHLEEQQARLAKTPAESETETTPAETAREEQDEAKPYDFRVWLTQNQKEALIGFLKLHNIKYGKAGKNG